MTEKDYLKSLEIKIIILSRSRFNSITTTRIMPDWIEVLVPESEKEMYQAKIPNPILTIPDEVCGLGAVRNWCLDNFQEETLIMVDDDIGNVYCLTGELSKQVTDPEEMVQILINTAVMAHDMGVHCFGYSQTDIRKYNATEPFYFSRWVGCVIGVIGRKYRFRNDKFKVDIDFVLQNLLADRIILHDARWYFNQNRDNNSGGNSKFRTQESFERSVQSLKEKWGKWINIKNHKGQLNITLNVKRKQDVKYEE